MKLTLSAFGERFFFVQHPVACGGANAPPPPEVSTSGGKFVARFTDDKRKPRDFCTSKNNVKKFAVGY